MPHLWSSLLTVLSEITRENDTSLVCCPHCGNRYSYVKCGFYSRYLFDDGLITIQRYRCDNDTCTRKTFSILPHAFLRITRASLCMFWKCMNNGDTIAFIVRDTGSNWPIIQRSIAKAMKIRDWIIKEYGGAPPCLSSKKNWAFFIRDFSWAFYPERYGQTAINTKRIFL